MRVTFDRGVTITWIASLLQVRVGSRSNLSFLLNLILETLTDPPPPWCLTRQYIIPQGTKTLSKDLFSFLQAITHIPVIWRFLDIKY